MVTYSEAHKIMSSDYRVWGTWRVDEQDARVWVTGHVTLMKKRPNLGVVFAEITGDFGAVHKDLESIQGLPEELGGELNLMGNHLRNLMGSPRRVSQSMHITEMDLLESLDGAPEKIGGAIYITYDPKLPLLRSLAASEVALIQGHSTHAKLFMNQISCQKILNDPRWIGQGKSGALNCALALKKAGLEGNAKW